MRPGFTILLVVIAFVSVACSGRGEGGDFDIVTYQTGDVLNEQQTSLKAVLDHGKPVVLNFWAGDCPPCRAEMPVLEDAWLEFRDDVVMLGVDIGPFMGLGTYAQGVALMQDTGVTYPAGNTPDFTILEDFNLTGLPATFFMKPDGSIIDRWSGTISSGPLRSRIRAMIDEPAG